MKHILLLYFLVGFSVSALAQEIIIDTSYYTPPSQRRRVLTADPEQNREQRNRPLSSRRSEYLTVHQLKEIQTWYAGLEGGFRSDGGVLNNSFDGLISTTTFTKGIWSALLGYTYKNVWTIETGYAHTPIHLNVSISNNPKPFVFNYQNSGHGIPLRIKRRLGSRSQAANGTGFWISAGAWLIPNGNSQMETLKFTGTTAYARSHRVDSLQLNVTTTTAAHITGLAEVGLDYAVRLAPFLELGFYGRKYWGLGNAIRSDLIYKVNGVVQSPSAITSDGSGWGFGMAMRYIYGRQQEIKKP